jgi:hypothetical protein
MFITHFMLTWFHYNKSIHFSPLPTTKLNEIYKKKKNTLKILMKIDNLYYNIKPKLFWLFVDFMKDWQIRFWTSKFHTSLLLFLLIFKAYFLFILFPILFLGIQGAFCLHFSLTLSRSKPSPTLSFFLYYSILGALWHHRSIIEENNWGFK